MRREPIGEPLHRLLVLAVDEAVDRALEPAPRRAREVVALLEVQARAARARLEAHAAGLIVAGLAADHLVRVAARRLDLAHQLERGAAPAERHLVDPSAQQSVAARVAGPQHL